MTCHFCFMNFESILLEASNRDKICAFALISFFYFCCMLIVFGFRTENTELGAVRKQRPVLSVAQGFRYFLQFRCGFFDNNCRIDFVLAL
jgi:hypothetical protein